MLNKLNSKIENHYNKIKNFFIILNTIGILILSIIIFIFVLVQGKKWNITLDLVLNTAVAVGTILLFVVTYKYVLLTRSLVYETRKTRESQEKPSISFRIIPDENYPNFLKYSIKNSGAGGAFDIQFSFDHDLDNGNFVGKIPKSISYLGPKEEIRFFFTNAPDYFENPNSIKQFTVNIKYSKYPISEKTKYGDGFYEPLIEYVVNVEELRYVSFEDRKSIHDIAKELIELKQGILLIGQKLVDLEEQHLNIQETEGKNKKP